MKKILAITYWSFNDPLIQTYTLPYLKIIRNVISKESKIFLFTQEQKKLAGDNSATNDVIEELKETGIEVLRRDYTPFGLKAGFRLTAMILNLKKFCTKNKITHIHTFCTPAGAIGYLVAKLTGIPLILDSYEPHAEAMMENGTWARKSMAFRILFQLERLQSQQADTVIACATNMRKYAEHKYSATFKHFYVKPACVDLELFPLRNDRKKLRKERGLEDNTVCIYAGKFGGIYLENEVFDFFRAAYDHWGERFRVVLLTGHSDEEIENYCRKANLPLNVVQKYYVPHREVPKYLSLADFAITPVKSVPTKKLCTPIKNGEYWAMGLPVVITPEISDDSEIIKRNSIGAVLESLNYNGYKAAIQQIDKLITDKTIRHKIRMIAEEKRNFKLAREIYASIYG